MGGSSDGSSSWWWLLCAGGVNLSMLTWVHTPESAASTSDSVSERTHPSSTKAWSLTATLTGAVAISRSLSRSSMPPNSMPPFDSDQSDSSDSSSSVLPSILDFLSSSLSILSEGRPSDSGTEMAWKSSAASISWTDWESSLRQNTATTDDLPASLLMWMAESPSPARAGLALASEETVPMNAVRLL